MIISTTILCSLSAWIGVSHAQLPGLFNITTFPNEQKDNVTKWLAEARTTAGVDLYPHFAHRCILGQVYPELSRAAQTPGFVTPREVFSRFYFIGQSAVSSWAYDTGEGLVVFDALNNAEEAEKILLPNLETLGFTGTDIKHLIITHEHFDHYGGARWLQDNFQPATYASAAAWEALAEVDDGPLKDKTIAEGDELTFGNVTFKFYVTPGHTPGTVSTIFSVYDHGVEHKAGFYGGVGTPSEATAKVQQIASFNRFADLGLEAGVDTLIANH
ncbi:Metallo-hydrolase/oxidoreductase, partial [Colletotrichum eremochloae]